MLQLTIKSQYGNELNIKGQNKSLCNSFALKMFSLCYLFIGNYCKLTDLRLVVSLIKSLKFGSHH